MLEIPLTELYKILKQCKETKSDNALRAAFEVEPLRQWSDALPKSSPTQDDRITALVESLRDRTTEKGNNALLILLAVFADNSENPSQALSDILNRLQPILNKRLHREFSDIIKTSQFKDEVELCRLFKDKRLSFLWKDNQPPVIASPKAISDKFIADMIYKLCDQQDDKGRNALALFVRVLYDCPNLPHEHRKPLRDLAKKLGLPFKLTKRSREELFDIIYRNSDDATLKSFCEKLVGDEICSGIFVRGDSKEQAIDCLLNYIANCGPSNSAVRKFRSVGSQFLRSRDVKSIQWPDRVFWNDGSFCTLDAPLHNVNDANWEKGENRSHATPSRNWWKTIGVILILILIFSFIYNFFKPSSPTPSQTPSSQTQVVSTLLTCGQPNQFKLPINYTMNLPEGTTDKYAIDVAVAPNTLIVQTTGDILVTFMDPAGAPVVPTIEGAEQRFAITQSGCHTLILAGKGRITIEAKLLN